MPRFSIKDLLVATTLIASGIALISLIPNYNKFVDGGRPIAGFLLCWFGGGASIGCGILTPFQRPWRGAAIGLALQILLVLIAWVAFLLNWFDF